MWLGKWVGFEVGTKSQTLKQIVPCFLANVAGAAGTKCQQYAGEEIALGIDAENNTFVKNLPLNVRLQGQQLSILLKLLVTLWAKT